MPALALGEAFHRGGHDPPVPGLPTALRCLDQRLTARQRQIVEHVALGQPNREIGEALDVSPHTVRNLPVAIRRRLVAANRAEIVRLAVLRQRRPSFLGWLTHAVPAAAKRHGASRCSGAA